MITPLLVSLGAILASWVFLWGLNEKGWWHGATSPFRLGRVRRSGTPPVALLAEQAVFLILRQLDGHVQHIAGVSCLQMAEDGERVCHPGHGHVQRNPLEIQAFMGLQQS